MGKLLKEWRLWILISLVILSIILIKPNPFAKGVEVLAVDQESPLAGVIQVGESITAINELEITPENIILFENYTGMLRIWHSGKLDLVRITEPGLGIEVGPARTSALKLGMGLVGGSRVLLQPSTEGVNETEIDQLIDQVIATLQMRMNLYGLREMSFQPVRDVAGNRYVQIEVAGATQSEIQELLAKEGVFEAYITRQVKIENGTGELELGDKRYSIGIIKNDTISLDGQEVKVNESVLLDDINFKLWNVSNSSVVLAGLVFSGEDIRHVYFDPQHSRVSRTAAGFEFQFQILVSDDGAARFAKVTEDIPVDIDPITGEKYLAERIFLFLDDKLMSSLRISSTLAGQAYTTPVITGGGQTRDEVLQEKRRLQSILRSGALPVSLSIVKVDSVSPSLGTGFVRTIMIAGLVAAVAVFIAVFVRYRSWIVIPMIIISFCEVLIILGVAVLIKWTIDLAAIAGIIAAIGTGIDQLIIITDEGMRKTRIISAKERTARAFFIIIGAVLTTVAAMLPLMFIGIGVMRGFAITTTIGVLSGILVTRPAYAKIVENFLISPKQ